ncbi:polysaccharide biosynthesis tyrosine autokinase [Methylobacterium sp. BTF04]|uniref:GumC family protein n=1 Tax=Methylobacterium sp. BTF04 TaxID=2708300 RepID=UPI0013D0C808|nr:exopolysaccharide transport family protein [Methylobacterium sp. BTF04]NEU10830.1 polysaccharide biosynthesis tyrosine autokinase [Methylobacterium sp. BTF04]
MAQIDRHIAAADWIDRGERGRPARAQTDTSAEIGDLWRILHARRAWVIGTAAFLGAIALAYGMLAPPLYAATAQILIDPRDKQIVTNDVNPIAMAPDGGVIQVESQARVIESDSVLTRAAIAAGLLTDPDFGGTSTGLLSWTLRTLQGTGEGTPAAEETKAEARAVRALRRKLAVKRADKVFVVDVVVTAGDPDKAARIVNAIATAYLQDQSAARAAAATRASGELRARLDDLRRQVNVAENKVEHFKAENGLISASGRLISEQQLAESNNRIVAARARTAEARTRLQQIKDARGTAFGPDATPEAIQSAVIERLRAQFAELASKEADLRTQLGARHPYMEAVRAQMQDVRRLIDAELNRISKSAETDYQRAAANEKALTASLDDLKQGTIVSGEASVRLRELEREVDSSRAIYGNFLNRAREIQEQAGIDTTNARVIGWARPPQDRSWPLRILLLVGGVVSGLGLGAGIAFVREYLDPTILSRGQLERISSASVLAGMPVFGPRTERAACVAAALALDRVAGMRGQTRTTDQGLCVFVTSGVADADERRSITRLLAAVAVTRGERVLIVEADLETGAATNRRDDGFAQVLIDAKPLQDATTRDPSSGAHHLALGDATRLSRDALDRTNIENFLTEARSAFDLVLIEGGALALNLRMTALALAADRLLVVARNGATRQRDVLDLLDVSEMMGRRISGSVLVGAGTA